jgi:hypothetical protein
MLGQRMKEIHASGDASDNKERGARPTQLDHYQEWVRSLRDDNPVMAPDEDENLVESDEELEG